MTTIPKTTTHKLIVADTRVVNDVAVDIARQILDLAETGEIFELAAAFMYHDGDSGNMFTATWRPVHLLGEMHLLQEEVRQCHIDTRLHQAGVPLG